MEFINQIVILVIFGLLLVVFLGPPGLVPAGKRADTSTAAV